MKVAIMATMPPDTYSGGRYYTFMLAEALAAGGHDTHFRYPLAKPDIGLI